MSPRVGAQHTRSFELSTAISLHTRTHTHVNRDHVRLRRRSMRGAYCCPTYKLLSALLEESG